MELRDFYKTIIRLGKEKDPRKNKSFSSFEDTAILYGDGGADIRKILVGIDIEVAEILLADRIRQSQGLDLVLSHHPEGKAFADIYRVMRLQVDVLRSAGVAQKVAEGCMDSRMREVERRLMPANHMRAVDAARLLNMPFMCSHTPADNHAADFIESLLKKEKPKKVRDIVELLLAVPEFRNASEESVGPRIILGNPNRPAGRVFTEMTGGTEGPKEIYEKLSKKGVRTLVCMHLSDDHFKNVKDQDLNVVIAGHISSDTLGLNLLFDAIDREKRLEVIGCSGFTRIRRK